VAIVAAILFAVAAFGAWLAVGVARWLREFAAAPSLRAAVQGLTQWWLFCWFLDWSWRAAYPPFVQSDKFGLDARIYLGGAQTWLSGGDPWTSVVWFNDAGTYGFHFAAPPPAVLLYVPFAWMPERLFANLAVLASFAAGLFLLRAVRLPAWWIVFPPLLLGILSANPVVIGLACIVSGVRWLAPVGFGAKVYLAAGLVAERRWKDLAFVVAIVAALVLLLMPLWIQYVSDYPSISATIAAESAGGFSATRAMPLFAATAVCVAALAVVDWRAACWLAVPALSPFAEFHSSIFALPVMAPGLGGLLAMAGAPSDAWAPLAICAYSIWRVGRRGAEMAGLRLPEWLDVQARRSEPAEPAPGPESVGAFEVLRGLLRGGPARAE
jgi:hypothetical protein